MFGDLLEPDYGLDNSPPDPTRITQVSLYYDAPDAAELRRLAKVAMKAEMPDAYIEKGNLSDILLLVLKKYYSENITPKSIHDGQRRGEASQEISY